MLADNFKKARLGRGLSQAGLARAVGVHVLTISRWERGVMEPKSGKLNQLAKALRISVDDLIR